MSEIDFKPNSHKFKEDLNSASDDRKKLEKVVKGNVKTRKKSSIRKFADDFIAEDAKNIKSYVVLDVLIPALKKAVSDIVTNGIDMILYGESGSNKKRSNSSYVSYRDYSDRRDDRYRDNRTRTGYGYDDLILDTRGEAEEVLSRMDELIETYGVATVADLYDLVGKSCNYTDNKYGWTNIRNSEAVRVRDGYLLQLPKALPIN